MRQLGWGVRLGIGLVFISLIIYSIDYLLTGRTIEIGSSILDSLGFLPISVLLVTLILNEMISKQSRDERLEKMNMVIGAYFSEIGIWLLTYLSDCDPQIQELKGDLVNIRIWPDSEFSRVQDKLSSHCYAVDMKKIDLQLLRSFLSSKRDFMLRLLENPTLLEHEQFTELLRASFHLEEELAYRKMLKGLPPEDCDHLARDIERAYVILVSEWLGYMRYLKDNCPYLFSLAMRINPFDENALVVISEVSEISPNRTSLQADRSGSAR